MTQKHEEHAVQGEGPLDRLLRKRKQDGATNVLLARIKTVAQIMIYSIRDPLKTTVIDKRTGEVIETR